MGFSEIACDLYYFAQRWKEQELMRWLVVFWPACRGRSLTYLGGSKVFAHNFYYFHVSAVISDIVGVLQSSGADGERYVAVVSGRSHAI